MAIGTKLHVVGISFLAAVHKTLLPQLTAALKAKGAADVVVVSGGVVPTVGLL